MNIKETNLSLSPAIVEIVTSSCTRREYDFDTKLLDMLVNYTKELARAKSEIEGMFEEPELMYLRDMLNGTLITEVFNPAEVLAWEAEDADLYEELGAKWGVNAKTLVEKLRHLKSFQAHALIKSVDEWFSEVVD